MPRATLLWVHKSQRVLPETFIGAEPDSSFWDSILSQIHKKGLKFDSGIGFVI